MRRTIAASALPAAAIAVGWLLTEDPRRLGGVAAVLALALAPALAPRAWQRALALPAAGAAVVWVSFDERPWELFSVRTNRALESVASSVGNGVGDFYGVVLPFDPSRHADMHSLVLVAIFAFVAATAQLLALGRPLAAAAVTIVGVGWPATLAGADVVVGALGLAAALSIFIALRTRSFSGLALALVVASGVVAGAAWASSATTFAQTAALDWKRWDFRGVPAKALGVRFVWDANYDGIAFPPTETVVLEVEGPKQAQYWRASTLDRFTADRWLEDLYPQLIAPADGAIPLDALAPARARNRANWIEQRVQVKALVDDHVIASGTPTAISARSLGTVFFLTGGVVRARRALAGGTQYRVWSYVPDPSPAALAAAPARYPVGANRFLTVWGRVLPPYGAVGREGRMEEYLTDPLFGALGEYRPLYDVARRVVSDAASPYAAVLALEAWFRRGGGFRYSERPSRSTALPPLVDFVTESRSGYCQHFAGAMSVMLRLLGVPSRVAVGFTSGKLVGGAWRVTDHDAHAWVEAWFPGYGWVAFDPTPGRGTFSGIYSFASENAQAVEALGRGDLAGVSGVTRRGREALGGRPVVAASPDRPPSLIGLALVLALAGGAAIGTVKWVVCRVRYVARSPRAAAAASRKELESYLRDQRIAVPASATLADLRRVVAEEIGVDGASYAEAAGRARFGPATQAAQSASAARTELRALLRSIRRELSPWARLRGFVSLRSAIEGRQA